MAFHVDAIGSVWDDQSSSLNGEAGSEGALAVSSPKIYIPCSTSEIPPLFFFFSSPCLVAGYRSFIIWSKPKDSPAIKVFCSVVARFGHGECRNLAKPVATCQHNYPPTRLARETCTDVTTGQPQAREIEIATAIAGKPKSCCATHIAQLSTANAPARAEISTCSVMPSMCTLPFGVDPARSHRPIHSSFARGGDDL